MRIRKKTLVVSLLIAGFLYVVVGFLLIPAIVLHTANSQLAKLATVPAHLSRVEFNPFSMELTLWGLHIGEADAPQLAFRRLYVNAELDSLWGGAVHLADAELERAHGEILFAQDGTFNLAQLFVLPDSAEPEPEQADKRVFPLRLDRLELISNSLHFVDQRPSEPVEFGYDALSLELNNLSTLPDDRAQMSLTASGPFGARLDWQGEATLVPITSKGSLRIQEVHLDTFWPYVRDQFALDLTDGVLNASTDYQLDLSERTDFKLSNAQLALTQFGIDAQAQPRVRVPQLAIRNASLDLVKQQASIEQISSQQLELWAAREADGQIDLLALLQRQSPTPNPATPAEEDPSQQQSTRQTRAAEEAEAQDVPQADSRAAEPATSEPPAPTEPSTSQPWQLQIAQADLKDYQLHLIDQVPAQDVALEIGPLNLSIRDFDSLGLKPFDLSLDTGLNNGGQLSAKGQVSLQPLGAELQVITSNIDLLLARPYVEPRVRIQLRSGKAHSDLKVSLGNVSPLQLTVSGDAEVSQLHLVDAERKRDLLKWQQLTLSGLRYTDNSLSIEQIALQQPYARFIINEDLTTNFSGLLIEQPGQPATSGNSDPMSIRIGGISLRDGSANFADFSLRPNFATAIGQLNGRIGTLDNQSSKSASVDVTGKVDRYAPVSIKGSLTPFDPLNSLDIATRFRNVELTTLTPYSGKFAGYRIRKGRLNLDLHYQIEKGQLTAQNKVLLEGLQLGERVDSPDAVDLPVRLAVALLKDTKGNIDIELPVSGNLEDPQFSVMPIVWQTLRNLALRAVQAPFKFIAGLVGGSDEDLSEVTFAAGSNNLDAAAQSNLNTLASALQERPVLTLEIEGMSSAEADGPILAAARLNGEYQEIQFKSLQAMGEKVPASPELLEIDDDDKPPLLEGIYRARMKQQPPADWAGLDREERAAKMEQALLELWSRSDLLLRRLAQSRAAEIKAYLVDSADLDAQRIYLVDVGKTEPTADTKVATALHLGSQ
ncbi:protein of unknown function [Halopseudomonas sabulinigri]|uniref:DUF748 domain-containing protein n=1 Tax=Halopseudomonas sabulinigri TaxID=472181 RepID=A0A1H1W7R6_9GAMM|nr:DUF748 domain-containing protein [Halopseudomonas sabulinigri]SDS93143.1 protein of unknown function [Halopseudomonas sabulinigri]